MLKLLTPLRRFLFPWSTVSRRNRDPWALDVPLITFSKGDEWTIGDATMGTAVFGSVGSGKTSGSGATIAKSFLSAGFGGLVLTAKPGESATWWEYAEECGRVDDLIIVDATSGDCFNFLDYERTRQGLGAGLTENIVVLVNNISEVLQRNQANAGRGDERFWRLSQDKLTRECIEILALAGEEVSVENLQRLVLSAPASVAMTTTEEWQKRSFLFRCMEQAENRISQTNRKRDFDHSFEYWFQEYAGLNDKTRSIIVSSFTSTIDILGRGLLRQLFTGKTNLTPDAALEGKIIIIDLPTKEFFEVGQIAQVIWKTQFQRCVERRDVNENPRPVFLWADEAHHFVTNNDQQFATTCRASRACTVYLTQSYSNFLAALGGDSGRAVVDSMLGCLQTKIFHASGDSVTNEWAAEIVGKVRQFFTNYSEHREPIDILDLVMPFACKPPSTTNGVTETMEYLLPPSTFTTLACGGPRENWEVTGVLFQGGRVFSNGRPFMFVSFDQHH